jgi:hypothetical protein
VGNRRGSAPLEVDGLVAVVDVNNLAGALSGSRIVDLGRPINGVILGRKLVAVDNRPLHSTHLSEIDKSTQSVLVLFELIVRELTEPEILPPSGLFFSPVPFQLLGKKPARPLLVRPF